MPLRGILFVVGRRTSRAPRNYGSCQLPIVDIIKELGPCNGPVVIALWAVAAHSAMANEACLMWHGNNSFVLNDGCSTSLDSAASRHRSVHPVLRRLPHHLASVAAAVPSALIPHVMRSTLGRGSVLWLTSVELITLEQLMLASERWYTVEYYVPGS